MNPQLRVTFLGAITAIALIASPCAGAQSEASATPPGAVPIERLVAAVAKRTNKKFIVDPRVHADVVMVGQEPTSVDYAALLLILRVYGFAAVEQGGYVQVVPDSNIRQYPLPVAMGKESYPDAEYVNRLVPLKSASAAQLVPVLRPLLPQVAHLVAFPCTNTLLIVDTYANVKRIEQLARAFDASGEPYTRPSMCKEEKPAG
jgi:general secretion pathway protein D